MRIFYLLSLFFFQNSLFAAPPRSIPPELVNEFTQNGEISFSSYYLDGSIPSDHPLVYDFAMVESYKQKAIRKEQSYYGPTDSFLYSALDRYRSAIEGKRVGIIGSTIPWYEAIILSYGGIPITIDYNPIISEHPEITAMTVGEYDQNPEIFDAILSISSFEHDGLGRYGDPINPNGDLDAMAKTRKMLKKDGLLFLAIPVGIDHIFWNAHRVYGPRRFYRLIKGWDLLSSVGFRNSDFSVFMDGYHQPVFVLKPQMNEK